MRKEIVPPRQIEQIATFVTLPRIQKLLCSLVRIPSPSGEEASLRQFVETYLGHHGIAAKRQRVTRNRFNLIVPGKELARASVLLNTHLDTVPSSSSANSVPRHKGNYIYGRGACDAKGSMAAMLIAFVSLRLLFGDEALPVELCLTVGEESSGDGSLRFARDCQKYSWAIVGEPTDLRIVNCHAGFVELTLTASSKPGHAFDPSGEQAITAVAELMLAIKNRAQREGEKPVHTFMDRIEGGDRSPFWSVRSSCKASLVVNTYSKAEVASVIRLARTCCAAVARRNKGVRIGLEIDSIEEGLQTSRKSPVVGFLATSLRAIGRPHSLKALPSWTDGARWCAAGIPTVVFGPGSLKDAHTDRERVNLTEVRDAALAVAGAILAWHSQRMT